jgi:hypothetical protein
VFESVFYLFFIYSNISFFIQRWVFLMIWSFTYAFIDGTLKMWCDATQLVCVFSCNSFGRRYLFLVDFPAINEVDDVISVFRELKFSKSIFF